MVNSSKIIRAKVARGKTNQGILCLKGCYGWDFINDTQVLIPHLKTSMIRHQRGGKLESVSQDGASDYVASRLSTIKAKYSPDAIQTTGSSRGTGNETNYVIQKFACTAIGTNSTSYCVRVWHGPSVIGLHQSVGNGTVGNTTNEIDNTNLVLIFGYNPANSHPIVASHVINTKRNRAKIIVHNPCKTETTCIADMYVALKSGSNTALLNAMDHVIVEEKLYGQAFVISHTGGFEEYSKVVEGYIPKFIKDITGVSTQDTRQVAHMYATAKSAAILWGTDVTQFYQDVEIVRSLASLAMLASNLGKLSADANPVRGQNDVQGAYDMGALPDTYPGCQYVKDPVNCEKLARAWDMESLPVHTGYRIGELPHRTIHGEVRVAYVMNKDPLQADAKPSAAHKDFEDLKLVVVQDTFIIKTAAVVDVILPSTLQGEHEGIFSAANRGFQCFFKAIEPKWSLKTDWQIISEIATHMGYLTYYNNIPEIWDELRHLCPDLYDATYEKMGKLGYIQWPCRNTSEADQGTSHLFKEKFDTPNDLVQFFTCNWVAPIDKLTEEYPVALSTVCRVGHYPCRSITSNCAVLTALADEPGYAQVNTVDAGRLGIQDEELVWVNSRKGRVITHTAVDGRPDKGAIHMTYQWQIGAYNELITENLGLITRMPKYRYCIVNAERIADQRATKQYVTDEYTGLKASLHESAMG